MRERASGLLLRVGHLISRVLQGGNGDGEEAILLPASVRKIIVHRSAGVAAASQVVLHGTCRGYYHYSCNTVLSVLQYV